MGIDLKVMASHFRERRGELLPTATVRFERDSALFSRLAIDAVPCLVEPLPPDLKIGSYEDDGLVFMHADRYGNPLTSTSRAHLATLEIPVEISAWNQAVLTFLLALPDDVRIVLFWC